MKLSIKILKPIITEKTTDLVKKQNVYTFQVTNDASSKSISSEVKKLFNVQVEDVRMLNMNGFVKTNAKSKTTFIKNKFKKAYVKIQKDQKIDLFNIGE
ncbi:MAG: 50S ribosomal protein L23 [bacterium]|jgi:large subunit ribosomal protein L23|nr:50S ribosomal protein L23 [bacterium]